MSKLTKGIIAGSIALTALATGIISQFEGRELRAYQDIVNVWTICDGETKGVKAGDVATPAQCDSMLAKNLITYEAGMDRCLTYPVPGKVKVAFLSLAYNIGTGAFCRSTLVRKANAGDVVGACEQILVWDKAGKPPRPVKGLTNRRKAERELCLEGAKA